MRSLASDNNSGVHPQIMDALIKANSNHSIAYGDDPWTKEAEQLVKKTFTENCLPLFVYNGTGSNIIALQLTTRPYNSIICTDASHIYVDECGSPVKATGCQIIPIHTPDGKLTPELIRPHLHGFGDQHHSQPGVIYISQCTEAGTVYTPDEIKAITQLAHSHHMYVHMDGARLANAAVALDCSLKELTVDCGVDILSFGGTKNGLMMGECVIIFREELFDAAAFIRKQSAQLASKMRYISCQFTALLTDNLWRENALHANRMAQILYSGLSKYKEVIFTQNVESNELFFILPQTLIDKLLTRFFFFVFNENINEVRLVTSFDTTEEDIESFLHYFDLYISGNEQLT